MWEFIFNSLWGWIGTATIVAIGAFAVAWFIKPLRPYAIAVGSVFIAFASVYAKGSRDRARLEASRKEEAVRKAQKEYADINARPDTASDVTRRMRDGGF